MAKSGVTNTLQESLMLEQQLKIAYDSLDKAETEKDVKHWFNVVHSIRERLYKLPNYNVNGLAKIMKFFKPYQGA
jgi:hypothetical protein